MILKLKEILIWFNFKNNFLHSGWNLTIFPFFISGGLQILRFQTPYNENRRFPFSFDVFWGQILVFVYCKCYQKLLLQIYSDISPICWYVEEYKWLEMEKRLTHEEAH